MKKSIINYTKAIWFKIMNDEMSRNEAIVLFFISMGISMLGIHIGDAINNGGNNDNLYRGILR